LYSKNSMPYCPVRTNSKTQYCNSFVLQCVNKWRIILVIVPVRYVELGTSIITEGELLSVESWLKNQVVGGTSNEQHGIPMKSLKCVWN
jgi:hypothetical protein